MSFDPTTFSFATSDASLLSYEQVNEVRRQSPDATTRELARDELRDRREAAKERMKQEDRDAKAAYDKVYLPLRRRVGPDDSLEISLHGDDVHALLFLCELGLRSRGIDPDRAMAGG